LVTTDIWLDRAQPARTPARVLLVCPPFQALTLSSLAVAQLATLLREAGVECREWYLHFAFARLAGTDAYNRIRDVRSGLLGELLFVEGLHGVPSDPQAVCELESLYGPPERRASLRQAIEDECIGRITRMQPDIVGFTTSFSQLLASLWLARVIKARFPDVFVVLGGAGCAAPVGARLVDAYPESDLVVGGYGEQPLLRLARGERPASRWLDHREPVDLDSLPVPDYSEYLEQARAFDPTASLSLTFESSRGCWWGQKNQCMFCGLNGVEIRFAAKSAPRVVGEVRELWERYRLDLYATDTILAHDHLRSAIVDLGGFDEGPHLFYECKANLTQADVVALHRARVKNIQPGIESLNTHILSLLRKGVTAIRNLALLKWCAERGVSVLWNMLCVIPGETFEDYDQQILLFDKIAQFQPPDAVKEVRIDRFSPYFRAYREHGWQRIEPLPEYQWLHPQLDAQDVQAIAYHFAGIDGVQPGRYLKRLRAAVAEWKERFKQSDGLFWTPEKGLVRNEHGQGFQYGKNALLERIIDLTHEVVPIEFVTREANCGRGQLDQLVKANILYVEGDKVLNLAVRTHPA
jgi:ribosomal peptide maturation radical SAM protein 1